MKMERRNGRRDWEWFGVTLPDRRREKCENVTEDVELKNTKGTTDKKAH